MSNICLNVKSFLVFLMEVNCPDNSIPKNRNASNVEDIHIPHVEKCLLLLFCIASFFLNEEMEESHGTEWQKSKVSGTDPTWFEWPGSRQPSVPELLVIYKGFDLCLQLDHSPCARMTWILTTCLCLIFRQCQSMSSFKDKSVCVLMSEQTGCLSTGHPVPTSSTSSDFHS